MRCFCVCACRHSPAHAPNRSCGVSSTRPSATAFVVALFRVPIATEAKRLASTRPRRVLARDIRRRRNFDFSDPKIRTWFRIWSVCVRSAAFFHQPRNSFSRLERILPCGCAFTRTRPKKSAVIVVSAVFVSPVRSDCHCVRRQLCPSVQCLMPFSCRSSAN